MHFYTKRRRNPVVPIVSLIDILAILLIFFIVTTTFKEKKNLLPIDLPETRRLEVLTTTENRATIAVSAEGELFLEDAPVAIEQLEPVLARLRRESPDARLELKADQTTELGLLVRIWDAIRGAGFQIKDVPSRVVIEGGGTAQ